ncbi:MAG TPA: hypothetical protein VFO78_04450 [Candidatus Limnocylindrales bacterium]|nr:hypothetical protein [Candidatus Limnocylindrales bacterium]
MRVEIAVESAAKKVFVTAVDWPGWSRGGKTEELAVASLLDHADRYAAVARRAGETFTDGAAIELEVVGRTTGGAGTEFGVPSVVSEPDRRPVDAAGAERLGRIVQAAWDTFADVAANAPEALRKGPRGGGRDTSKIVSHVAESDGGYAREMGIKLKAPLEEVRAAILGVLREPSDGSPIAGRRWTPRYAAHRIAWHALDHAWEIENRTEPAD